MAHDVKEFIMLLMKQIQYYSIGFFTGQEKPHKIHPENKFNMMQKVTYLQLMFFVAPLSFITGLMMWNVNAFTPVIDFIGGIRVVSTIHMLFCIIFVFFIPVHAYMGFLGRKPLTHYKEMITGYEE
jgi:thiosulfate reductase cytochrome b subunit